MRPLFLDIAIGHLTRRRRQAVVSLLGVALGVGFFIGIAALMQGFQRYFVAKVIDVSPHVIIKDEYRTPPEQPAQRIFAGLVSIAGLKPKDEPRGIKNAKAKLADLGEMPGVAVSGVLSGQIILRYGTREVAGTILGIDPAAERQVSNIEADMTRGRLDDLYRTANGIVLGAGLAGKLGAALGDTLTAVSPAGVILLVKVVGLFTTGITTVDNAQSYLLLKKAQVLLERPNVINMIRLRLARVEGAEALARQIEARWSYRTESWEESNRNVLGIFVIQNGIMYSTTGAILIVAAFGIFNVISTVVLEKTRDIAILKSIGFRTRDVERIFLAEGVIVGALGAVLGWAVGFALTEVLASIRFTVEGFVKSEGFVLYRSPWHYGFGALAALASASFAAWLPARRAARVDPVDIVRGAA